MRFGQRGWHLRFRHAHQAGIPDSRHREVPEHVQPPGLVSWAPPKACAPSPRCRRDQLQAPPSPSCRCRHSDPRHRRVSAYVQPRNRRLRTGPAGSISGADRRAVASSVPPEETWEGGEGRVKLWANLRTRGQAQHAPLLTPLLPPHSQGGGNATHARASAAFPRA